MYKDTTGTGKTQTDWQKISFFKMGKKEIKEFGGLSTVSIQKSRQEDYTGGKRKIK